jgi:hypothetical protein
MGSPPTAVSISSAARAIRTIPTASIPITTTTILLPTVEAPVLENMPIPVHGVTRMAFVKGLIHLTDGGTTQGGSSGTTLHQV